jgi:HK97 family phage major capsid protein
VQKTFAEFRAANDEKLASKADVLLEEKVDRINDAVDVAHEKLKELETITNRPNFGGSTSENEVSGRAKEFFASLRKNKDEEIIITEQKVEQFQKYENAYKHLISAKHRDDLPANIRNDLQVGSDSAGGYFIPPVTYSGIEKRIFETSPMRQYATVVQTSNRSFSKLSQPGEFTDGGWVAESTLPTVTDTPEVGLSEIFVHEQYAMPRVTQQMLEDAGFNLEAWVASEVADKLSRVQNTAFVSGNGVSKPKGFLAYASTAVTTTDEAGRAWGKLQYVPSGAAGAFPTTSGIAGAQNFDSIQDLIDSLKDDYLGNAVFAMKKSTRGALRKVKDGEGRYMIDFQERTFTLQGFDIAIMNDMPALAGDSFSIAFGDFSAYQIVDRLGLSLLRDPYTDKPYVKYYFRTRVGGDLINFDKIKLMKFATS